MSDSLKDHIERQRDEFEIYPFDTDVNWKEIEKKVIPSEKWPRWKYISAAACFLLVAVSSIYQLMPSNGPSSELVELEQYYNGEINQKISLVKNQLDDPSILDDLDAMDHAFSELKADLKDNVDNEEVVAAMMENYQLKLRILEEILNELEKEKSETSL